ncbi:g11407 [Coccomyxa elongata]
MRFNTNLQTSCHPLQILHARSALQPRSRREHSIPRASPRDRQPSGAEKDDERSSSPEGKSSPKVTALHTRVTSALSKKVEQLMGEIMPQERGDARDWALMWTSIAIFVYASMHLYRLYAHVYYSLGLRPLIQVLRH